MYFTPDEDGTYYVSAGGYTHRTGTYTLRGGSGPPRGNIDDPPATGNIDYPGDRDWFAVDLEAGKTYRFDLEGWSTGGGTLDDPYLRGIYDANGDRIDGTTNDDGGSGRNSRVYFTPDESATYYVSAGSDRSDTRGNRHLHADGRERDGRLRGRCHHDRDGCGRRLGHGHESTPR